MDKDYRSLEHKIRDLMVKEAMARNSAKRMQVTNVARPDTATDPTDVKSKIAKQGEIKTKIIDEDTDAPEVADKKKKGDDDAAPKKAKSDEMDDKDAKEIKGGKTEVDLDPKTDDDPDESAEEDKKSKKATKAENAKIGAKSGVKEEMTNTPFGLPQSLIDSVTEALKGGQKNLDKNHNGKLDGQDFKILRGETKAKAKPQYDKARPAFKEEAEQIDELSKKTLGNYVKSAAASMDDMRADNEKGKEMGAGSDPYLVKKIKQRSQGKYVANVKLAGGARVNATEEVEQIDEVSAEVKKNNPMVFGDKKKSNPMVFGDKKRDNPLVFGDKKKSNPLVHKEEVQLSAEELARIESIAKGME
jgi:hypothetical protein